MSDLRPPFVQAMSRGALLLDGSTGTEFMRLRLSEADMRGDRFREHPCALASDFDILCLSRPELVTSVHESYLSAGADIIETNTCCAIRFSQSRFGTASLTDEINREAARLAAEAAARYSTAERPRYVAGAIGPVAPNADPTALTEAYTEQATGLIEGGADLLLIETAFDLNCTLCAAKACRWAMERLGRELPVVFSFTSTDPTGRIHSGHTIGEILTAVAPFRPAALGFNCGSGPATLLPAIGRLIQESPYPIVYYPSAGLPRSGELPSPEEFAGILSPLLPSLSIVGGCCGTTPSHIAALAQLISRNTSKVTSP